MTSEFIHIEVCYEDDGGFSVHVQLPDVEETTDVAELTDLFLAVFALLAEMDEHTDGIFSQVVRSVLNDIAAGNLDNPIYRFMEGHEDG